MGVMDYNPKYGSTQEMMMQKIRALSDEVRENNALLKKLLEEMPEASLRKLKEGLAESSPRQYEWQL